MQSNEKKIWFPAKKYGWGWGPPCAWQGWVVLAVWTLFLCAGSLLLPHHMGIYVAYTVVLSVILIVICYCKGEKPRWRWGKE